MPEHRKKSKEKRTGSKSLKRNRTARPSLRVVIIGPGRLGTVLGRGLSRAGYRFEAIVSRRLGHAKIAAQRISSRASSFSSGQLTRLSTIQLARLNRCDIVLITTPDEAIGAVASQLAKIFDTKTQNRRRDAPIALHTSGALSSAVLKPLSQAGFATGSLHPLLAVSDPMTDPDVFRGVFFCVEGDSAAARLARSIVRDLGAESFTIDTDMKALYHASAVMASGHVVALFDIALEMLGRCGLSQPAARKVLLPLLASTAGNLAARVPARALTGTFARGDISTVRKHLAAIKSGELSEAMNAYIVLARRSLLLAKKTNPKSRELAQVTKLLRPERRSSSRARFPQPSAPIARSFSG